MSNYIKPWEDMTFLERYERNKKAKALILDTSSSMNSDCEISPTGTVSGVRKIDALRNIVSQTHTPLAISFNDTAEVCDPKKVPDAVGSTRMSAALEVLIKHGVKEAIVLTDGDVNVDDQDRTIALALANGIKLNILYIGAGPKPLFLDRLAKECGGTCTAEDLTSQRELGEKVERLLLGAPNDEPKKKERVFEL